MDSKEQPPEYEDVVSEADEKQRIPTQDSDSDVSLQTNSLKAAGNKTLIVDAKGLDCGLSPPSELQTYIANTDGSPAYISTKAKRMSGNCVLSSSDKGDIISTHYKFGPGRPPELEYCHPALPSSTVTLKSGFVSRTCHFTDSKGKTFEWEYGRDKATKSNLLILSEKGTGKQKDGKDKALATLVRNDETRSSGSGKWTAGNGGELIISENASAVIDEPLIIATCLVMLKKEIDRRRQAVVAAVSS